MIYTVGYQRLTIKRLTQLMGYLSVDLLVDVRKRPFSHITGYSSGALVARFGDKYIMKGAILGGGGNVTPEGIEYLRQFEDVDGVPSEKNCLIMCMEDFPLDCHRHTAICAPHFPSALHYYDGTIVNAGQMEAAMLAEAECPILADVEFEEA